MSHTHKPPELEAPSITLDPLKRACERLAWRKAEVAAAIGISERALEREISAGRFPKPDRVVGRMPIWSDATVRRWLTEGGSR